MKKIFHSYIAIGLIIIAVLAGGYYLTRPGDAAVFPEGFKWEFVSKGQDESVGAPKTAVTLIGPSGTRYEAGEYYGTCFDITNDSKWTIDLLEKQAVVCWWAGVGSEIGVWQEEGSLVMKVGVLEEGTAETAPTRGNFKEILRIK